MTHPIIKTENYLLVVDESEIKVMDWFYLDDAIIIAQYIADKPVKESKKITFHLPLNNAPTLEGVPLLPPLEDDESICPYPEEKQNAVDWNNGYNKAKEKYKYTEEEYNKLLSFIKKIDDEGYDPYDSAHHLQVSRYVDEARNIIQSLQQPKYPVAFECQMIALYTDGYTDDRVRRFYGVPKPKTITNSQGLTQLVGKYIY
jgi:hypothetical protein